MTISSSSRHMTGFTISVAGIVLARRRRRPTMLLAARISGTDSVINELICLRIYINRYNIRCI